MHLNKKKQPYKCDSIWSGLFHPDYIQQLNFVLLIALTC